MVATTLRILGTAEFQPGIYTMREPASKERTMAKTSLEGRSISTVPVTVTICRCYRTTPL